ncbi:MULTISPECIES: efflux RND transporter periplasmic adaptor subunit [Pelosinus]|uniref:Efflux transporter, RND family, MFP subunit n=1 Tax=Pelosinus fermentans B4 TaxID=1149862 RepID=I8RK75_9FIRM|nr:MULTISPECIES: efflux RND transporter periplasmic adaptor subunit [Pelosinus]EIW20538.1 efflux transporter, RND family, MFP subunit [Pelosinus fermentans B4]EIW25747.1 efflux transporter, RND family, MFP subunit [Pelosinus fermentans A11]OAM93471.1 efflux transporter, RND family, MFP subunit [Pelosinus fermentans DSM 17108]SDQ79029.1 membrane fusion protein, multidrug efflux system [Pelosinus fermentans]
MLAELREVNNLVRISSKVRWRNYMALIIFSMVIISGCSKQAAPAPQAVEVKAMQVVRKDTPIAYEFVGTIEAKNEVQVRAKVSGNIVDKMVTGGAEVTEGQPIFRIDSRQYNSALLTNQATAAQAEALLAKTRKDVDRYNQLASQGAVSQQTLDNSLAEERQNAAAANANWAKVQQAQQDLEDTTILSPLNGRIDINDLSIGSFVSAGSTIMATISSVDPVMVKFSMSENEYLQFAKNKGASPAEWGGDLKLILSDGSAYPLTGQIEQVDKGLATGTGTLSFKASFANPDKLLVPGMFARVAVQSEVRPGALLIPQRAVQQMLDKTLVTVVGEGDKAETRVVKMGTKVGNMWVVEEGVTENDRIVVEGFLKTPPGTPVSVIMIGPDELQTPAKQ